MMTGMPRVASRRRSLRANSRPLTPGSIQSSRMRSGRACSISRSAFTASATVRVSKPARVSASCTISRMAASSSMRRMRLPTTGSSCAVGSRRPISSSGHDMDVTVVRARIPCAPRTACAGTHVRSAPGNRPRDGVPEDVRAAARPDRAGHRHVSRPVRGERSRQREGNQVARHRGRAREGRRHPRISRRGTSYRDRERARRTYPCRRRRRGRGRWKSAGRSPPMPSSRASTR